MEDQQVLLFILISIILSLLFSFSVIWILNKAKKKVIETTLKQQELEIELQQKLLKNTITTQEIERQRIAKDLHDEISSKLNIVHLNLHLIKKKVPEDIENIKIIDVIENSLKESISRARMIAHELIPPTFKKFGIHAAIADIADEINISGQIEFELKNHHHINFENSDNSLHFFRIIQELINNSLKYGKPKNIILSFANEVNGFSSFYIDDGIGYDPKTVEEGLGFSNIRKRLNVIKGSMVDSSEYGVGCKVFFKIPQDG